MARFAPVARGRAALGLVAGLTFLAVASAGAAEDVGAFRTRIQKWVETRQIISKERSDWAVEQETLRATRDLLKQQRQALKEDIAALGAESTEADEERRELLLKRAEYQRAASSLEGEIRAMEEKVLALAPLFPEPLQKKLDPLLVQIPEDPESSRVPLGQRLMNVLGVLAQAERFNGTATFVAETRAVGDGPKVQVRTLYWGLGQAFYVDAQGRTAGIGRVGKHGWEFTNDPSLAERAKQLLDIYEGNVDTIEFVRLPVETR